MIGSKIEDRLRQEAPENKITFLEADNYAQFEQMYVASQILFNLINGR